MSARRRKRAFPGAIAVLAVALLVAGCGARQPAPPPASSPARSTPGPSPMRLWVAVFQSAEDPNDLENAAEELMDQAGTAVLVAPEGCFGGLRGRGGVRAGHYVLGVQAESRERLQAVLRRVDRKPSVIATVEDLCPM